MVPLLALLLLCSPRSLAGVSSEPPPPYRWVDLNLRDLGAKEGAANWPATSAAIRAGVAAVRRAGGGTLRIPAGQFTAAPFNMTSNMTLYLERGAVLLGTSVFAAHPIVPPLPSYGSGRDHAHGNRRTSLIHGEHLENVKVLGDWGTIDGNGAQWWQAHTNHSEGSVTRGSLIEFMYCEGVEIGHLHLKDSPFWTGMRPLAAIDRWLLCSALLCSALLCVRATCASEWVLLVYLRAQSTRTPAATCTSTTSTSRRHLARSTQTEWIQIRARMS
jgi:hypothetical protein